MIEDSCKSFFEVTRMKLIACDYYLMTGESSKIWSALEEAGGLISDLDMFYEYQYFRDPILDADATNWYIKNRNMALERFDAASEEMISFFNQPSKLDPILSEFKTDAESYLDLKQKFLQVWPRDREAQLPSKQLEFKAWVFKEHKQSFYELLERLTDLRDAAQHSLNLKFGISSRQFVRIIPNITFCHREALHRLGIFRHAHLKRHLIFSKQVHFGKTAVKEIYLTLELDRYLLLRSLFLNSLRSMGRFIPLHFNHTIIKFYNDPIYWDNPHMFFTDRDHLRLGMAYFQYAMELGRDSAYSRMAYRNAQSCLNRSGMAIPETVHGKLWKA